MTRPIPEDGARRSAFVLLRDVIVAPWDAFRHIGRQEGVTWLLPAFLIVVTALGVLAVQAPYVAKFMRQQLESQLGTMSPEQADLVRQQSEQFLRPTVIIISGSLTTVVVTALVWLLMAGVLYMLLLLAGLEGTFGQAWAVTIWANLPFAVRHVVQAAWIYTHQALFQYPGLSRLVATGDLAIDQRNPLIAILGQLDLPALWHVALVYWAFRGAWRASRRQAALATAVYAGIMLAMPAVPVLLARWFTG